MTIKVSPAPVLDRARPSGDIYGAEEIEGRRPRFFQDGHYYSGDGTYLSSEENCRRSPDVVVEEKQVLVHSAVTKDDEVAALLEDPAADDLLAMDRETLVEMVKQANGPVLSGDGSSRMMAAWLIKHTMAPPADPAPLPPLQEPAPQLPTSEAQGELIAPEAEASAPAEGASAPTEAEQPEATGVPAGSPEA